MGSVCSSTASTYRRGRRAASLGCHQFSSMEILDAKQSGVGVMSALRARAVAVTPRHSASRSRGTRRCTQGRAR